MRMLRLIIDVDMVICVILKVCMYFIMYVFFFLIERFLEMLDVGGYCVLEMFLGIGKIVFLLFLIVVYQ